MAEKREWLRPAEAAERLGLSPKSLTRLEDAGKLLAFRTPGGHRRYIADDVDALARRDQEED